MNPVVKLSLLLLLFLNASPLLGAGPDVVRYTGDGDEIDFAMEVEGKVARLYLAKIPTNEPLSGVKPLLVPDDEAVASIHFKETSEAGVYVTFVESTKLPEGSIEVEVDGQVVSAEAYKVEGANAHAGHEDHGHAHAIAGDGNEGKKINPLFVMLVSGIGVFLMGLIIGKRFGRSGVVVAGEAEAVIIEEENSEGTSEEAQAERRSPDRKSFNKVVGLLLMATGGLTLLPSEGRAGGGHSHGEVEIGTSNENTEVEISKKSQFLLGLRTQAAKLTNQHDTLETFGHVTVKPQLDAVVRAPTAGFVRGISKHLWGSKVKKGEVIANIESIGNIKLVAPRSGILLETHVSEGVRVEAGDSIFRIVDLSSVWVDAEVFQKDLPKLEGSEAATVVFEGLNKQKFTGKVVGAKTQVDENTLAAKVFLEIDNQDGKIPLGGLAHVSFELGTTERSGVLLPKAAVLNRGGERIVYIQTSAETFRPKPVTTKFTSRPGEVIVTNGLEDGERVVVMGNYQLLVGAK
jgi:biotin carboxyl carrier protein